MRFCPTTGNADRVPSWDGIPLDVDVTLPPDGDGPFPTIVMLHGYGGSKTDFERSTPEGTSSGTYHYNNNFYARQGYAVVNYSARGFGNSCGRQKTAPTPECGPGYLHLADSRFEVRDTQFLLGLLVDQGVARAGALGATGISYGGGQSFQLAYLRDRVRNSNGSFAQWRSPNGTPLSIAAAWPRWPWSDLTYSLLPNGRFLDFRVSPPGESLDPLGVAIQSYVNGLYALGKANGYYCGDAVGSIPCPETGAANINVGFAEVLKGEPPSAAGIAQAQELHDLHSAVGIGGAPAPLLVQNGWTDDLFPVHEALRIYNRERARSSSAPISLQFGDLGHSRGSNKENVDQYFNDQGVEFFDARLRGVGSAPAPGSVTTFTQTCPRGAPGGGPFTASSWPAIHPGAVRFGSAPAQTVTSTGGNPATARNYDPTGGTTDACQTTGDENAPGTAVYRGPSSQGFTLMGRPTVTATIDTAGDHGQLDSRLWDVGPDGRQTLISRGAYRLRNDQDGAVTFQLNGNGWRFESGHVPKLELLGRDAATTAGLGTLGTGYLRPSNTQFSVRVSGLTIELPTLERPNGGQIVAPRFAREPVRDRIALAASPRTARVNRRTRFTFTAFVGSGSDRHRLRGATIRFAGRRARTSRRGRVTFVRALRRRGGYTARASATGYRSGTARVSVRGAQRRGGPLFTG